MTAVRNSFGVNSYEVNDGPEEDDHLRVSNLEHCKQLNIIIHTLGHSVRLFTTLLIE